MCWYTDFLFVISIKYDSKYLLSTYYSLKINCGLGVLGKLNFFNIQSLSLSGIYAFL
jgi:hypothetical protein